MNGMTPSQFAFIFTSADHESKFNYRSNTEICIMGGKE